MDVLNRCLYELGHDARRSCADRPAAPRHSVPDDEVAAFGPKPGHPCRRPSRSRTTVPSWIRATRHSLQPHLHEPGPFLRWRQPSWFAFPGPRRLSFLRSRSGRRPEHGVLHSKDELKSLRSRDVRFDQLGLVSTEHTRHPVGPGQVVTTPRRHRCSSQRRRVSA